MALHQLDAVAARQHQVQQHQVGRFLPHEPGDLLRVSGHGGRVARPGQGVPDVPEGLRIVVHAEDAGPLRFLSRPSPGPGGGAPRRLPDRRNGEGEPASQSQPVALGPDAPPMGLHDPPADGQAQAGPAGLPSPLLAVQPRELPEQVRQALGGHAHAVVGHREGDVDAVPHGGDPDGGQLVGVPGRVGQQVVQHLDDAPPVRQDPGQPRRDVDDQVAPAAPALEPAPGLVHQDGHVDGFGGYRQGPRLDAGHVEEVADQVAHALRLVADDPEELGHLGGVQLRRSLQQGVDRPLDGGQRRPQLVAHHAQELGPQPLQGPPEATGPAWSPPLKRPPHPPRRWAWS